MLAPYQSKTVYFRFLLFLKLIHGVVRFKTNSLKSLNRIVIEITNTNNNKVYKAITDEWGYYNVTGLTCGKYVIRLVSEILKKNIKLVDENLSVKTIYIPCEIEEDENIDFIVE